MNAYTIRITTVDCLYTDYIVEAEDLFEAKSKVKKAFFRDYPNANKNIKLSLVEPSEKVITQIMEIIKEANSGSN